MAKYTEEFIAKVKRIYPDSKEIHMHAEQHHGILGRYLDDSCKSTLDIDWIMKQGHINVVHDRCRKEMEKVELYKEWCKDYAK
jgi:hypothetical protein